MHDCRGLRGRWQINHAGFQEDPYDCFSHSCERQSNRRRKDKTAMKDLLHVVVGAGFPDYLRNCVRSIEALTADDVLVYYNFVDEADLAAALTVSAEFDERRIDFRFQPNNPGTRSGSLYDAYNSALSLAQANYRYISFTQSDMQMMWWDHKVVAACDAILSQSESAGKRRTCFFTQVPVRGKRVDYYSIWGSLDSSEPPVAPGLSDVGIYPLKYFHPSSFRFEGTEKELSAFYGARDTYVALHPYPFLAPIPFPHTLREKRKGANSVKTSTYPTPILLNSTNFRDFADFRKETFHPLYMEDTVLPNGWTALSPYWPSDTLGNQWMKIRLEQSRKEGSPLFQFAGSNLPPLLGRAQRFRPGFGAIFRAIVGILLEAVRGRIYS